MSRSSAKSDPVADLTAMVAALAAQVAALTAGNAPAPVAAPATTTRAKKSPAKSTGKPKKSPKVYTWKPWACSKFGIPAIVGASFAYNGKNGTTDHVVTSVTADGIVTSTRA